MTARSLSELRMNADSYLKEYTDPAGHYAWNTYDQSTIHGGALQPSDVLMANLVSLRLTWQHVTPLFAAESSPATRLLDALNGALEEARALPALEECNEVDVAMPALKAANEATHPTTPKPTDLHGWTPVTVSKVLHRLAPTIPIVDSYTRDFYAVKKGESLLYRRRLSDDLRENEGWLRPLARGFPVRQADAPLCRIADILIWMERVRQRGVTPIGAATAGT